MRGALPDLATAAPMVATMPAIYQEDGFTTRLTAGLDSVLAPVLATLDCVEAYVDPILAPDDFLPWLAGWVGLALAEDWEPARQRALLARIVPLYQRRGTAEGVRAEVELYTDGDVEVIETGAAAWSSAPNGAPPGVPGWRITVRVAVDDASAVNRTGLDAVVAAATPAHVIPSVEVVARPNRRRSES